MGGREMAQVMLVLALAATIRLVWVSTIEPAGGLVNDAGYYDAFARGIAAGDGYAMPDGTPTAFWPVGYPATLAALYTACGHSRAVAVGFNVVVETATVALLYLLARRWFPHRTALGAAAIYAVLPGAVTFTSLTLSEPWFTCLFVAALTTLAWADRRARLWRWAVLFGLIAAAAAYVRGQGLLLPVLAVPWLWLAGLRFPRALGFGALSLGVVLIAAAPWVVRNTRLFGEPVLLSTNLGQDFWTGHHPGADGGLSYDDQLAFAASFAHLPPLERERAINREGLRQGLRFARTHPVEEGRLLVRKLWRLYRDDGDGLRWNEQHGAAPRFTPAVRTALHAVTNVAYWALLIAALIGLGRGLQRRRPWADGLLMVLLAWTGTHLAFFAEPRFHAPLLPLLALAAAALMDVSMGERAAACRSAHAARLPDTSIARSSSRGIDGGPRSPGSPGR
jgi:4-amino-4-deoxy-L-arabinose transferase-like glycosyltransferase